MTTRSLYLSWSAIPPRSTSTTGPRCGPPTQTSLATAPAQDPRKRKPATTRRWDAACSATSADRCQTHGSGVSARPARRGRGVARRPRSRRLRHQHLDADRLVRLVVAHLGQADPPRDDGTPLLWGVG